MPLLLPPRSVPEMREAIPQWLDQWRFTRFVTLATNDPDLGNKFDQLRGTLREWDGRMNRAIIGREWASRDADRMFAFYTLEKPAANPHWHGLIRFFGETDEIKSDQQRIFDEEAEPTWKRLVPSGTANVQPIFDQTGVAEYVAKCIGYPLSYEHYVVPDEFKRG